MDSEITLNARGDEMTSSSSGGRLAAMI